MAIVVRVLIPNCLERSIDLKWILENYTVDLSYRWCRGGSSHKSLCHSPSRTEVLDTHRCSPSGIVVPDVVFVFVVVDSWLLVCFVVLRVVVVARGMSCCSSYRYGVRGVVDVRRVVARGALVRLVVDRNVVARLVVDRSTVVRTAVVRVACRLVVVRGTRH